MRIIFDYLQIPAVDDCSFPSLHSANNNWLHCPFPTKVSKDQPCGLYQGKADAGAALVLEVAVVVVVVLAAKAVVAEVVVPAPVPESGAEEAPGGEGAWRSCIRGRSSTETIQSMAVFW